MKLGYMRVEIGRVKIVLLVANMAAFVLSEHDILVDLKRNNNFVVQELVYLKEYLMESPVIFRLMYYPSGLYHYLSIYYCETIAYSYTKT